MRIFALLAVLIPTLAPAATTSDEEISTLAVRIRQLAAKESLWPRLDTELRAAELLIRVQPPAAAQFRASALGLLREHRNLQPTSGMVSSLLAVAPDAEPLLLELDDRRDAYNSLIYYWSQRRDPRRAASLIRRALDAGITDLTGSESAVTQLAEIDPVAGADLAALIATRAGKYRAVMAGVAGLAKAATTNPNGVAAGLQRLLPVLRDPKFATDPNETVTATHIVGGNTLTTTTTRESVLFPVAVLLHTLDPDAFQKEQRLFGQWSSVLANVRTLEMAIAAATAKSRRYESNRPPGAAPPPEIAAIRASLTALKTEHDPVRQKALVADTLTLIDKLDATLQRRWVPSLFNTLEELKPEPAVFEPVAARFLSTIEHGDENPDDYAWLSSIRRQYSLAAGGDNPSVRSRDALAELAELVSTDFDFSLENLDGARVTLQGQRGKVVLLNFWATWCPPCREEMPMLERLYREHRDQGFTLLAVSDESPDTVRAFIRKNGYTFPILIDPDRRVFDHYRVQGIPATKVIDRTGRIRAQINEVSEAALMRLLRIAGLP